MKKVVNENIVDIDNVIEGKYYGVKMYQIKSFIAKNDYHSDISNFFIKCFNKMTMGNRFSYKSNSLKDLIVDIFEETTAQVFEFDTWQELLKWAIKE